MGNMKKLKICEALCLVCAALAMTGAHAAAAAGSLTPLGADAAASADGKVPAWTGADGIDRGWKYGQSRAEAWKYNGEKPTVTIDASNAAQYKDYLTDGEMSLLKTIPGYKMEIYPTHRDCGAPDFVAKNTKANEGYAALADDDRTDNILRQYSSIPDDVLAARRHSEVHIAPPQAIEFGLVQGVREFALPKGHQIIQI